MEEKTSITNQFANVNARRIALDNANLPLIAKRDDLDQQVANWEATIQEIKVRFMPSHAVRPDAPFRKGLGLLLKSESRLPRTKNIGLRN
jgi:hypothetical protein